MEILKGKDDFKKEDHCKILDTVGDGLWLVVLITLAKERTIPYLSQYSQDNTVTVCFSRKYKSVELNELTNNEHIGQEYQYNESEKEFPHKYHLVFPNPYDMSDDGENDRENDGERKKEKE